MIDKKFNVFYEFYYLNEDKGSVQAKGLAAKNY